MVTALISLLLAIFLPVLARVRAAADAARCSANLRQLYSANVLYAAENGTYVAGAADLFTSNLQRWHGVRGSHSEPFDFSRSPLAPYLGGEKRIKTCPAFLRYRTDPTDAFEASCGGYGYNIYGVGSQSYLYGFNAQGVASGMSPGMIRDPVHTVMFADCAFPQPYHNPEYLIEYSFAEPPHFVDGKTGKETRQLAMPSIHFRHNGRANVIWCDGHISQEKMSFTYDDAFRRFSVGWFGPQDNRLFDPY